MMTRRSTRVPVAAASLVLCAGLARAQSFAEGFESGTIPGTWTILNKSSATGTTTWHAGATNTAGNVNFGPHSGGFLASVDYFCGSGLATLSNWLISPQVTLRNGDSFAFWTRSTDGVFPDRMQVRMSAAGASLNVGASATDVGDFTTLLLDINPGYTGTGYPLAYQSYVVSVSGLGGATPGRLAFRYFVEGGGPSGSRSDSVGIDDIAYTSITDPTGACCLPDASCAATASGACAGLGGVYRGDGSVCASANCPSGACCLPSLACVITAAGGCASQGGTYHGDGSTCAAGTCPNAGACCYPNGTCSQLGGPSCVAGGGIYRGNDTLCATANCPAPSIGPDVIVGEVYDVSRDGAVGAITAYSVGTDSCNLGDLGVVWFQNTNQHPVISGNMFRLKTVAGAARFEQIGMSWYKHGFFATNGNFCGFAGGCTTSDGNHLGPHGCSDVYSSGLNGSQGGMGARSELNATTGVFPYPSVLQGDTSTVIGKRCQCLTADIDPAQNSGALYFAEAHYSVPDDAQWATAGNNAINGLNNYSYRQILISSVTATPSFVAGNPGLTRMQLPAIQAWKEQDPTVTVVNADYLDTTTATPIIARFQIAAKATNLGGGQWHYEYAISNVNADRSGGSFSVPLYAGTQIGSVGFHAPFYHSGEVYDNTAWTGAVSAAGVSWVPAAFSPLANSNALRWGTLYNYRFDANVAPATGAVTLGLFKPGTPTSITVGGLPVPGQPCYPDCDGSTTGPILNIADFTCFLQKFSNADPYANCDASTTPPVLNVADFTCFLQKFAVGCP